MLDNLYKVLAFICLFFLVSCSNKISELRIEGIELLEKGKYQESIDTFNEALDRSKGKISTEQFDILCYKAEALYMLGEYDEAKEALEILIETDGNKASYQKMLEKVEAKFLIRDASLALDDDDVDTARSKLMLAREAGLENDKDYIFNMAVYLEKTAQWNEAFMVLSSYNEQYPGDEDAERELMFLKSRVEALNENEARQGG